MNIETLRTALNATKRAEIELEGEQHKAINAAQHAIYEQFAERRQDAAKARHDAQRAYDAAMVAEANANPLVGRKVMKPARPGSWRFGDNAKPEQHGVIEVFREGDPYSKSYTPDAGTLVVRVLKKDGTSSTRAIDCYNGELPYGWQFEDVV